MGCGDGTHAWDGPWTPAARGDVTAGLVGGTAMRGQYLGNILVAPNLVHQQHGGLSEAIHSLHAHHNNVSARISRLMSNPIHVRPVDR